MKLYILLASYNGETYIGEQIDSICNQTFSDWRLLIRDDASTDNTVNIIQKKILQDNRIELISDDLGNQGVIGNFNSLVNIALARNAEYVMFSDQDDIWKVDKIELSITKISEVENKYGKDTPILVHTDLAVINESKELINISFLRFQHLHHEYSRQTEVLLTQNFVTGCTVILNSALLKVSTPIPNTAIMHDWWFALSSSVFGRLAFLPAQTVLYRQHSENLEGSSGFFSKFNFMNGTLQKVLRLNQEKLERSINQACSIYSIAAHASQENNVKQKLHSYCTLKESRLSYFEKLKALLRSGAHKQGLFRNIVFYYHAFKFILLKQ